MTTERGYETTEVANNEDEYGIKILDPEKVRLFQAGDALRVTIEGDRSCLRVAPVRTFPISMRNQYISLQDGEGNELGLIKDPDQLDQESRKQLEEALHRRYFTPLIRNIHALRDKLGIMEWEVETDRGMKQFFTRGLHKSLTPTDAGFIITDIEENRYEIRLDSGFDSQSKALLLGKI